MQEIRKKALLFYPPKDNVLTDLPKVKRILNEKGWEYDEYKPGEEVKEYDKTADLALILGGDGTILHASRFIQDVPILGVNYGKIGYLAEIIPGELAHALDLIKEERYWIEEVYRLEGHLTNKNGEKKELPSVLNEFLIFTSKLSKMISYEIYLDGEPLTKGKGDGFIVSTSIGTTAYALSAGGPVFIGDVKGFLIVPMAPLWGKLRPLVVPDYLTITIRLLSDGWPGIVVCDGIDRYKLDVGDSITMWLSNKKTKFIRFSSRYARLTRLMLIL
ncbi:MAG: NAD(+)/NADH kinase [Candidatus Njordarchaeia archaeon]